LSFKKEYATLVAMEKAHQIAKYNLHACFEGSGIVASIDHFDDFWARDSFYASWGLLEEGEYEMVKSNLNLFVRHQKKDGQIARRIDRFYVTLHYLGIGAKRKKPKPMFAGAHLYPALDPNILFIITSHRYVTKTNDHDFLQKHFDAIYRAMQWLEKYERNSFLNEGPLANWMDTVIKRGAVLYTNVLYSEALKSFAELCSLLDKTALTENYTKKKKELAKRINDEFWNGSHYVDWIDKGKKYNFFSTDGNVLAMLFGISSQEQNAKIIRQIEKAWMDIIPMRTNHPGYPRWRVCFWMYFRGTPGYQNNYASWLWLGSVYAVALYRNDYKKKALKIHELIAKKITEYKAVYETYAPDGTPYKGWCWKCTKSFAWSAGLFLWADSILPKALEPEGIQND
jgi:glycogen debranching enzyme